jgi:C_GCAxxG_C_C family probable redox protein
MKKAVEYFNNGYSCSESIVKAAAEAGFCDEKLIAVATPFSGGMSSGCLCGAIAGGQIVLGSVCARDEVRASAGKFVDEFIKRNKVTCCRALTHGLEGAQRKEHCSKMVSDCAQILEDLTISYTHTQGNNR